MEAEGLEANGEGPAPGATATGSGFDSAAAAAASIALMGAGREEANAFLKKQSVLVDLQAKELAHELKLRHWSLQLRHASAILKLALEVSVALIAIALASVIGVAFWNAMHDHDLVIDAFAVPPDLAARGLTGQIVAAELLDKFSAMQAQTAPTAQSAGSYHLNAGDTIRIAIPETGGVSIGDIDRSLREWLGHEVHVSGEVIHTGEGLAITVRSGTSAGLRTEGSNIDALMQKTAENLFAQTEPFRYADYLGDRGRLLDAIAILQPLSLNGPPRERALALTSWAEGLDFSGRPAEALPIAEDAIRLVPTSGSFAYAVVSDANNAMGHDQAAYEAETAAVLYAPRSWTNEELTSQALRSYPLLMAARRDAHAGDYSASGTDWARMVERGGLGIADIDALGTLLETVPALLGAHDIEAARRGIRDAGPSGIPGEDEVAFARAVLGYSMDDWRMAADEGARLQSSAHITPYIRVWASVVVLPLQAVAMARVGDVMGAKMLIERTPLDCDACVRARGQIAAIAHDWQGAGRWFAMVAVRSPSIPFAETDWGEALLAKGDLEEAMVKFAAANKISPHFADPLEGWGEALLAKSRSDLALAKFEEANKYAPNWGQLHLKWGEALYYAGKKDEGAKQLAQAATLDLTPSERAELAGMNHG